MDNVSINSSSCALITPPSEVLLSQGQGIFCGDADHQFCVHRRREGKSGQCVRLHHHLPAVQHCHIRPLKGPIHLPSTMAKNLGREIVPKNGRNLLREREHAKKNCDANIFFRTFITHTFDPYSWMHLLGQDLETNLPHFFPQVFDARALAKKMAWDFFCLYFDQNIQMNNPSSPVQKKTLIVMTPGMYFISTLLWWLNTYYYYVFMRGFGHPKEDAPCARNMI